MKTITIPTADEQLFQAINKGARKTSQIDVVADQKLACVLLTLAPAVTQGDYQTLKANIEAIAGIQAAELAVDGQVPSVLPADCTTKVLVSADLRCYSNPATPT